MTQPPFWVRLAHTLSVIIAVAATLLFILVSVFSVPFILRWDAAKPVLLLVLYVFLFAVTTLPFFAIRYFGRIKQADDLRPRRAAPLFMFAGLFVIPALLLLPQVVNTPHIFGQAMDTLMFGLPGLLCVALACILAHRAIAVARGKT